MSTTILEIVPNTRYAEVADAALITEQKTDGFNLSFMVTEDTQTRPWTINVSSVKQLPQREDIPSHMLIVGTVTNKSIPSFVVAVYTPRILGGSGSGFIIVNPGMPEKKYTLDDLNREVALAQTGHATH